jgi:muscarinic acetylcholine receptor M3
MNQAWIGLSNADKIGTHFDDNIFFLSSDLFLNGTINDGSNDINLIYQSFLSSSTMISSDINGISSSIEKMILTFLMSTMAFLTVFGNSLVIMAFICEPTIRTYSNYFILNLSIADLLIGLIW